MHVWPEYHCLSHHVTLVCEELPRDTLDSHPLDGHGFAQIFHHVIVRVKDVAGQAKVCYLHYAGFVNPVDVEISVARAFL